MSLLSRIRDIINGDKENAVNKFGFNNDVDTAASEDVCSFGGLYPYATFSTPQTLELVSTSANDAAAGTGTQELLIIGLDENGAEKNQYIIPTGITPASLGGQWTAINRAFVLDGKTGALGTNDGDINIRVPGPGATVAQIPAKRGQTQQCVYRVPSGKKLRLLNLLAYTDASVGKTASFQLISVGEDCLTTRVLSSGTATENSKWEREYKRGGKVFEAGQWAAIRVFQVGQNDTAVTADFDGVLE
jgi:hypothetical protein